MVFPPGDLPNSGIETGSPALVDSPPQVDSLPAELPGKPWREGMECFKIRNKTKMPDHTI